MKSTMSDHPVRLDEAVDVTHRVEDGLAHLVVWQLRGVAEVGEEPGGLPQVDYRLRLAEPLLAQGLHSRLLAHHPMPRMRR